MTHLSGFALRPLLYFSAENGPLSLTCYFQPSLGTPTLMPLVKITIPYTVRITHSHGSRLANARAIPHTSYTWIKFLSHSIHFSRNSASAHLPSRIYGFSNLLFFIWLYLHCITHIWFRFYFKASLYFDSHHWLYAISLASFTFSSLSSFLQNFASINTHL
jgi:hypothetical protein